MSMSRRVRNENNRQNHRLDDHDEQGNYPILPERSGKIRSPDDRRARSRSKTPAWVVVLLVALGVVCYGVLIAGCLVILGPGKGTANKTYTHEESVPPETAKAKTLTRDEFTRAVMGKTKEEIIKLLGLPSRTTRYGGGSESWIYQRRSRDAVTGRDDSSALISLNRDGKATRVAFFE